jgi:predicted nucleotidyltransferase
MEILETIKVKSAELGLQFLVIGGHAIIAYGYERQTGDLDLLVRRTDQKKWADLLISLGCNLVHEQDPFAQFSPSSNFGWPVDLMFGNEQTFSGMLAEAKESTVTGIAVKIPSLEHLIALKLHALKNTHGRRGLKDLVDVVSLLEANKIDVGSDKFKRLCERYGTDKIYDQIIAISSK